MFLSVDTGRAGTNPFCETSSPSLRSDSDSGRPWDHITNDATPTMYGTYREIDAAVCSKVELWDGGTKVGETTTLSRNLWTITSTTLTDGQHNLKAIAYQGAQQNQTSTWYQLLIDTTVSATVVSFEMQASSDSGASSSDEITNDTTPTFDVTTSAADANNILFLREGPNQLAVAFSSTTAYTITPANPLPDGTHSLQAVLTDEAGNSAPPVPLTVVIDTVATVSAPDLKASSDTGLSHSDNLTSDTSPAFTGSGERQAAIKLVEGTNVLTTGSANNSGAWALSALLSYGVHNIHAETVDIAGNVASSAALQVTVGPMCLGQPASRFGGNGPDDITGTAQADVIHGRGGADIIHGGGGADRICGGPGTDLLFGEGSNDRLDGGSGAGDECDGGPGGGDTATPGCEIQTTIP